MTPATARRILLTLEQLGYVRSDNRRFSLTPRVLALGWAYLSSLDLGELAGPFADGCAPVDQELELGLRSIAAPIHNSRGRITTALTHRGM
ncbi:helix-turn-helix domain-containing protein [Kribbella shirazensis]|uniref:helix-turn-helix domain-containing protein n=1 Tax=Kribbella shirazensis TaxID=1105143 RepID=UPI001423F792